MARPSKKSSPVSPFDLRTIPGIGKTFVEDFSRIGITRVDDFCRQSPEDLFAELVSANEKVGHKTSKNYLYVLRMCVYYAEGGREPEKLRWNAWKDQ